jgi:DNA repair protein RecO (recombination protein O)
MTSRERSFRVEAVVLRHSDWGEADRLLGLFTLEMGKIRAVAKGVRKIRSRKAGHLEPFTHVNLLLARGRDTLLITQADTVEAYLSLRGDLLRVTYASYVVELLDRFTYEEGENRALYRLLVETLARLSSEGNPDLAVRFFEIRFLDLVGFRPQLFHCLGCEGEIKPQDQYFSADLGGVLCPQCSHLDPRARAVTTNVLRYLRHFQRSTWNEVSRAPFSPSLNHDIENLIQYYLTYLLERSLNTPAFLRNVRNPPGNSSYASSPNPSKDLED